ncbi:MAG: haloacid dehalogenase type II [Acidiferrobacterales bacterium]|nr:haloacid dehalogenase type II [Acidiferrobacterales bacterium]
MKISDFSTLTFDCYGTLIDWESGIFDALTPLNDRCGKSMDRDAWLLEFSRTESVIQSVEPELSYARLLAKTHEAMAKNLSVPMGDSDHVAFSASIEHWPAFPDSVQSLQYLKEHFKLVILSNVNNAGFEFSNRHLKVEFDAVYTAEDIGSYKPSHKNFDYMLDHLQDLGVSKSEILHTAQSLFHDIVPATEIGLTTCWIDRRAAQSGSGATPAVENPPTPDMRFVSLADMVKAHRLEQQ